MDVRDKLRILASAARYDASCASSGSKGRGEAGKLGSTDGMGICHSYTPDGRCVSLLKVLLTNHCIYDCQYCESRASSNLPRARLSVPELCDLTMAFYRRNLIEGLFLSSGIPQSPDETMQELVLVAKTLRQAHGFRGYIHLKAVAGASAALLDEAGRYADRLSANVELPTEDDLRQLAPDKSRPIIEDAMGHMRARIDEATAEKRNTRAALAKGAASFAPAGQSTQMIVGATPSTDATVLRTAHALTSAYRLRRIYYSAYSPTPAADARLPTKPPPLVREHRLYQADWLLRFYGFAVDEIVSDARPMLDLDVDPKLAWALLHRERFPVDVNTASREELLRVPGLGVRVVERVLVARRHRNLGFADLATLGARSRKLRPFVAVAERNPALAQLDGAHLRRALVRPKQLSLLA